MNPSSLPRAATPLRKRLAILAALAAIGAAGAGPASALDLTLEVSGARSSQGHVMAALYDSEQGWLKTALRGERVAAGERCVLVFKDLPAGTYAVAVFHDENGNGRHDRNAVGIPIEPYGFSRDAAGKFGPPKFDAAAVLVQGDMTLAVKLQ